MRTPLLALSAFRLEGIEKADRAELMRILERRRDRNLLALDLREVRRDLLTHPWVRDAVVSRVFPRTLAASVAEKTAAAVAVLEGAPRLVDAAGAPIVPWTPGQGRLDLPLVTGADAAAGRGGDPLLRAAAVRRGLLALAALRDYDPPLLRDVGEVDVSQADRLILRLVDEPAPLFLSRENPTANLDHYFAVRQDIRRRFEAVSAVDLRWRGRVTVVPATLPQEKAREEPKSRDGGQGTDAGPTRGPDGVQARKVRRDG